MAYTPTRFVGPTALNSVPTQLVSFTNPAIIKQIHLTNVTGGTLFFSIYLLRANEQVGANSSKIYGDYSISGNQVIDFNLSLVVGTGESLWAVANVPNAVNATISGVTAA